MWLRQSTASQEILLGPFLDSANGNDQETALTIANTDIQIWKEGGTTEANKNSGGATHIANGRYYAVLDATDTNTLGKLEVNVHVTGALAVRREFMVLPANVYDSLVLDTDVLQVDTTQVSGTAQTANDNGADINTLLTRLVGTIAAGTHNPQTGDAYAIVNSGTFGNAQLVRSTTPANTLDVNATGGAGLDWANVDGQGSAVNLSATTTNLVNTTTTNTDMRGTDNALLAASAPTNFGDLAITVTTGLVSVGTLDTDVIDAASLATTAVDEIRDGLLPTQNAVFNNIEFLFVATSDHVTPVTGATGTAVTRSIDGGAFGAGTGTLAEVANGIYQYDASAADMNGGVITFRFTATGGTPGAPDDSFLTIVTGGGV